MHSLGQAPFRKEKQIPRGLTKKCSWKAWQLEARLAGAEWMCWESLVRTDIKSYKVTAGTLELILWKNQRAIASCSHSDSTWINGAFSAVTTDYTLPCFWRWEWIETFLKKKTCIFILILSFTEITPLISSFLLTLSTYCVQLHLSPKIIRICFQAFPTEM